MAESTQEVQAPGPANAEPRATTSQPKDARSPGKARNTDLLARNKLYPEADALFAFGPKPVETVTAFSIVVLDTNQLLLPYTVSQNALSDIGKVYEHLIAEGRLVVPGQVAREFVDHRFTKIAEAVSALDQFRSSLGNQVKVLRREHDYPFLKGLPEYVELGRRVAVAAERARACIEAYSDVNEQIGNLVSVIQGWYANDPVSELYRGLFCRPGVVVDIAFDHDEIQEDFAYRKVNRVPPGFNDEGIGDLLIWKTILEVGQNTGKPVIFVSGDEKNDWLRKTGNIIISPRYELVDEFRRSSGGESFYFVSLATLLRLFGASQESIQEVQESDQAAARERARTFAQASSTTTTTTTTSNTSASRPGGGSSGPTTPFQGTSFSGASPYLGTPTGSMTSFSPGASSVAEWENPALGARSGSGGGQISEVEPQAALRLYWEDGETSSMTYDRGVWRGPTHRITASGARVTVPMVEVTETSVIVDGVHYPRDDSSGAVVADFVHQGHRI